MYSVIPTLYRIVLCRSRAVVFRLLIGVHVAGCSVVFPGVSSFAVCRGIIVVDMWDFEWVICLVNVVPD